MEVEAIGDGDLPVVSQFLHEHLDSRLPVAVWEQSFRYPWMPDRPNHGFLLRDGARIVGVFAAIYAERNVRGKAERFCNLAAWYVLPEYRAHGIRLILALLSQRGFHFVDLTPSAQVERILLGMRFQPLPSRMIVLPNLPWGGLGGGASILSDPEEIARALSGDARRAYLDHRGVGPCRHLAVRAARGACHVVFHGGRVRGLPAVVVLHASDPDVFTRNLSLLGRHFLLRHGAVATKAAARLLRRRLLLSFDRPRPRAMYLSRRLGQDDFDNLYSELVMLPYYHEGHHG